jgi:hypothetical protein
MTLFARRTKADPWWDLEGVAARRTRVRRQVLGLTAFFTAEVACGLTLAVCLSRLIPALPHLG